MSFLEDHEDEMKGCYNPVAVGCGVVMFMIVGFLLLLLGQACNGPCWNL